MFGASSFILILLWGGWSGLGFKGYEDHAMPLACEEAKTHTNSILLKVSYHPSSTRYVVLCNSPRCDEPPATVIVEKVDCRYLPEEVKTETIAPRWEILTEIKSQPSPYNGTYIEGLRIDPLTGNVGIGTP